MCRTRSQRWQFLGSSTVRNKLVPTEKEGAVQDVVRKVSALRGGDEGCDQGELGVGLEVEPTGNRQGHPTAQQRALVGGHGHPVEQQPAAVRDDVSSAAE